MYARKLRPCRQPQHSGVPAWKNQSLPIDRRTRRQVGRFRGEAADAERIGGVPPALPWSANGAVKKAPAPLLAHAWNIGADSINWRLISSADGLARGGMADARRQHRNAGNNRQHSGDRQDAEQQTGDARHDQCRGGEAAELIGQSRATDQAH
jgi:hypothetical protein